MIGAFVGRKKLFELYEKAIGGNYRFYSFWDGMLIE
jgi:S-adenosylmethionine:tRNA-ribosyltransferase-isomerase (queuine synthetase)